MRYTFEKPPHYKSALIVYDKSALLIISFTNTLFQAQKVLGAGYLDYELTEDDKFIYVISEE